MRNNSRKMVTALIHFTLVASSLVAKQTSHEHIEMINADVGKTSM